jgi:hypothetical protein
MTKGILVCAILLSLPLTWHNPKRLVSETELQLGGDAFSRECQPFPCSDDRLPPLPLQRGGPRFTLSQRYPTSKPSLPMPWIDNNRALDFRLQSQWKDYLNVILQQCLRDNIPVDWNPNLNTQDPRWFHAPWMHYGSIGREPLRGLTYERKSRMYELSPSQKDIHQSWAVSLYNKIGAYTFYKVWKNPNSPDITNIEFNEGTVAIKLLFTQADTDSVPYLQDSLVWKAFIFNTVPVRTQDINISDARKPQDVRLIQVDLAVRDNRAGVSRWVFGTYIYNSHIKPSTECKFDVFCKLAPMGIMWGNNNPIYYKNKPETRDSYFTEKENLPNELLQARDSRIETRRDWKFGLGYEGRLNGPLDNPESSCLSCHSTAKRPYADFVPPDNSITTNREEWFRTFDARDRNQRPAFMRDHIPFDFSQQLAAGIHYFCGHPDHKDSSPCKSKKEIFKIISGKEGKPD